MANWHGKDLAGPALARMLAFPSPSLTLRPDMTDVLKSINKSSSAASGSYATSNTGNAGHFYIDEVAQSRS